jgi:hypothetical protein
MEINVVVSLDGKNINVSDNLSETLVNLVSSYIRQTLSQTVGKKEKVKRVKTIGLKREPRPKITLEEKENIIREARNFQQMTASKAAFQLHPIVKRATGTIFGILKKAERDGRLNFVSVK